MAVFPQGFTNLLQRCSNTGDGGSERRTLQQLARCLEDDYMVWHNVPLGERALQPDFVILHPQRGLLILEVKGWSANSLITVNRDRVEHATPTGPTMSMHPLQQSRSYAHALVRLLEGDAALCHERGPHKGKLIIPWGYGAVMAKISRSDIQDPHWDEVFPASRTLIKEDLSDSLPADEFQARLWGMFTVTHRHTLTLPQRERVRWHLFPELRIPTQSQLFDTEDDTLSTSDALLQMMDLQQETLARTIGDGHRVIHGVAGSGKTMILIHRAAALVGAATPDRPILVLCYNSPLALRLEALLRGRGMDERVQVRTFHSWCFDMCRHYQLTLPRNHKRKPDYAALADSVVQAIEHGRIPRGQYTALLIDEAHDFEDEWLRLAPQLINPNTRSLLVMYDDAQSIYRQPRTKFTFSSVGIEARGRTHVLKINYRNTHEILSLAAHMAGALLNTSATKAPNDQSPAEADDDIAHVQPTTGGRRGPRPILIQAMHAREEAELLVNHLLSKLHDSGPNPIDVAVLARRHDLLDPIEAALQERKIPTQRLKDKKSWEPNTIKLSTVHAAKGLEFHTAAIVGLQAIPDPHQSTEEEWRLLYVGMTRATHQLILSACGPSPAVDRVAQLLAH